MPYPHLSVSATIPAPPERVYAILADYEQAHPQILPKPPFVSLEVEEGGQGTGTVLTLTTKTLGRTQTLHGTVTEPEPGRLLVESYDNGYVTSFAVQSRDEGKASHVTITTELTGRTGIAGKIEGWLVGRLFAPVYAKELATLAALADHSSSA